jgi:DUF1365 family protein
MWRPEDQYGTGTVWHRRVQPKAHAFRYRLWFSLLDIERLQERFAQSRLWSMGRFGLVRFRRDDYFHEPSEPDALLVDAVRDRIERELGERPDGSIRMLTHLRQWGMVFNPVSFYFAHHDDGSLMAILAEVHNTPWGERHAYVLDARGQSGPQYRFRFGKDFHVSPFLPMDMDYEWRFELEADALTVHMRVTQEGQDWLSTGMKLALKPLLPSAMNRLPLTFPLLAARVAGGIYWQAFKLYVKRIPFHDHPQGLENVDDGR